MTERPERQDLPRIELEFPATVLLENGSLIHVEGTDISRGGMGLGCDRSTAHAMVLRGSLVSPDAGAEFNVQWELPGPGDGAPLPLRLGARARLAWSRPMGAAGYRVGLQFLSFEGQSGAHLASFVERSLQE